MFHDVLCDWFMNENSRWNWWCNNEQRCSRNEKQNTLLSAEQESNAWNPSSQMFQKKGGTVELLGKSFSNKFRCPSQWTNFREFRNSG